MVRDMQGSPLESLSFRQPSCGALRGVNCPPGLSNCWLSWLSWGSGPFKVWPRWVPAQESGSSAEDHRMTAYTTSLTWMGEVLMSDGRPLGTTQGHPTNAGLAPEELAELRQILLDRRQSLSEQMAAIESEADRQNAQSPLRMEPAERRRIAWDCTVSRIAVNRKFSLLCEVDQALRRMDEGTYGVDVTTGFAIPLERLREVPWARSA